MTSSIAGSTVANNNSVTVFLAATALAAAVLIPTLKLDSVAKVVLSPDRLREKRRAEALYRLENSTRLSFKKQCERVSKLHGKSDAEFVRGKEEIKQLAKDALRKDEFPEILAIKNSDDEGQETTRPTKEIYLLLSLENGKRWVQVPLVQFCSALSNEFEQVLTSTALCFVADASGGLGPRVLGEVLKREDIGMALVTEPSWMTALAILIETRLLNQQDKLRKIMFSLCRLEAWRVRGDVGKSRTVTFFLPGQSSTSSLVNLLQSAFPCERHVFAYDGCAASVTRASAFFSSSNASVSIASLHISQPQQFRSKLSRLSATQANAVEAWMSSVSSFLAMKEDEKNNEYLPFVCRLGFIMGNTDGIGDTNSDMSELALSNVLQYMTGSRSRPLEKSVIESAFATLNKFVKLEKQVNYPSLSEKDRITIEDCVFCHKGILIGDKTLIDTVQPMTEWSLKAAKKLTGCSCCAPEEEDDDEEEELSRDAVSSPTQTIEETSSIKTSKNTRPKFKDGKQGFAFDPNIFTGGTKLNMS